jgi:hypothetical protein
MQSWVPLPLKLPIRDSGQQFIDFHVRSSSFKRKCHPDRSEACPSDLTAPNKSHRPPLCHPERTRISYFTALPAATYAALRKESRMRSTEATVFDRKSGGAEGPAVCPGSRTKVSVPLVLPQNRHPACPGLPWERSASQINRSTQRLVRGVEGPRRCLIYPCCSELFNHRPPTAILVCRHYSDAGGTASVCR